jgi:hypothetical protein
MDAIAAGVRDAFVAAYPGYVRGRVGALHPEAVPGVDDAVASGARWLSDQLSVLLAAPFREQQRSPLEVFQEAMRFPTEALERAGVPAPDRDGTARRALPGDRYDLAPASSQDLGEEAWRAHLAWGAAKARALARPLVGLLSGDIMDRTRVESAADAAGYTVVSWADGTAVGAAGGRMPPAAFVDLEHPDADEVIRFLAGRGARVTAFGPHVDDFAMLRAQMLGAADAMPRSRFFRVIRDLLPPVV